MRLLLALVAVCSGFGCEGCDEAEETAAAEVDRTAAEAPQSLSWEARLTGGSATLGAARELIGDPALSLAVARTPGEALERFAPELSLGDRVAEDEVLHAVGVRDSEGEGRIAIAARIRVDDEPEPLGAGVTLTAGAPRGGRWIGREPDEDDEAAALVDDVLVLAETREALQAALPYLAFTLVPSEAEGNGLRVRTPDGVFGHLRALADETWRSRSRALRLAARAERSRHEEAPELGEPEAVVDVLDRWLGRWIAFLPDVGESTTELAVANGSATLAVDAAIRAGSPLARELDGVPMGAPYGVSSLPESTALAIGLRATRDGALALVEAFERVGGARLSETDRTTIRSGAESWRAARGEGLLLALGADEGGPWAILASAGEGAGERVSVDQVLGVDYVRAVGGALLGCDGGLTYTGASLGSGGSARPLCGRRTGGPAAVAPTGPVLIDARPDGARVFQLVGPPPTVEETAPGSSRPTVDTSHHTEAALSVGRHLAAESRGRLGDHPDVQRALDAAGDRVLLVAVAVPSRMIAAGALLAPPLRAIAARATGGSSGAPVILTVARTDEGVRVALTVGVSALGDLVALLRPFLLE